MIRLFVDIMGRIRKAWQDCKKQLKEEERLRQRGFVVCCSCAGQPDISDHMTEESKGARWKFKCPECDRTSTFLMGAPCPIPLND